MMKIRFSLEKTAFPGTGESLLYLVFSDTFEKDTSLAQLNSFSKGRLFEKMKEAQFNGKARQILSVDVDGGYKQVIVVGVGKKESVTPAIVMDAIAEVVRYLNKQRQKSLSVFIQKEWGIDFGKAGEIISTAIYLANYHFSKYKSHEKSEGPSEVTQVQALIDSSLATADIQKRIKTGFMRGELLAQGMYLARDLVNEPASHIYPITLAAEAKKIAKESEGRITVKVLSQSECEKMGMGSYLGVAQGSDKEPQFIILHFTPNDPPVNKKRICLIGKSVTFDTGGYQIKPDTYMNDMKIDMAGGATMLGVFRILTDWDEKAYGAIKYDVVGILPACENMISGRAFRPGDVLTAMNGKTIEVRHTDAEGRLTLADALVYAERELKADIAIDFATLTGAIMVALGNKIAGLFGNDAQLNQDFLLAAKEQGEEAWEMPLPDFYKEDIKSDIADLSNLGKDRYGGAITAALFLKEFAGKMKWMHLDIAGIAQNDGGPSGIVAKGGTGWGVRTLIQVLTTSL